MIRLGVFEPSPRGGLLRYAESMCEALSERGIKVCLQVPKNAEVIACSYCVRNDLSEPRDVVRNHILRRIDVLLTGVTNACCRERFVSEYRPDIMHLNDFLIGIDLFGITPLRRIAPIVYTAHDIIPHKTYMLHPLLDFLQWQRVFRSVDAIVVHTKENKVQLLSRYHVNPENVYIIPHGARLLPRAGQDAAASVRRRLGLPVNAFIVLFAGVLRANKGIEDVLRCADSLRSEEIRYVIVGSSRDATISKKVLDAAQSKETIIARVEWLTDDELDDYFRACNVVALPYTRFGSQSGVLLRAYAHCKPVIVTRVGGLEEVVTEDSTGIVIEPGDVVGLARAIHYLSQAPEAYQTFASNMRDSVERKYDWSLVADRLLAVYEKVLTKK